MTSFRLEPFDFGADDDGDSFLTYIVSAEILAAPGRAQRQKTTDKQRRALEALAEATLARGREPPAELGLPRDIKAVSAQAWLDELLHANVLDPEKNPKGRFGELRTSLAARHLIGTRDDFVWLPRPPSPYRASVANAPTTNGGGEPVEPVTVSERDALKQRGFSNEAVLDMNPQHARAILADASRNADTERFKVVGEVLGTDTCAMCGEAGGVQLIKDSRTGGKPVALHLRRCARKWYDSKDVPPLDDPDDLPL